MSGKENPCRKFQANIFNKSKCQNCFKPRELHLLTDQDLTQAKPIYGGWLCLAPEGTDFENPMQRSRKWQRRFFVLYEHGCLRFALDESPSTLPQGTVNMNQCTDVIDAEPKTGQKNALCIITPEQEYYIRGDNKEIINGWSEQLCVYPRTNKQNQKKKRKVEPTTSQEPGPAKVASTGLGIPEVEKVTDSQSMLWQEELQAKEAGAPHGSPLPLAGDAPLTDLHSDQGSVNGDEVEQGSSLSFHGTVPLDILSPTGSSSSRHSMGDPGGIPRCHSPAPSDPFPSGSSLLSNGSHISGSMSSLDSDASGSTVASTDSPRPPAGLYDPPRSRRMEAEARKAEKRSRARSPERQESEQQLSPESSRSNVIEKLEALELENAEQMEVEEAGRSGARQGRSETRRFQREEQKSDSRQGLEFGRSALPPLRRAKSLDRRTTESVMTPDLLNFKKGWMVKLDDQGQWKKYWFVLTDHSLRYYKDSIAEEASDLDGEIDLTTCYNVTEYPVQRNYGFQIHTQEAVYTLSAMTAGIRRNWIQAVMKNVRPSNAPDVASLTDGHGQCGQLETLLRPDVAQDSPSSETSSVEREPGVKKSRVRERRREGRSKTFDWAEFRPIAQALAQQRAREADAVQAQLGEMERNRRREERRKRYESALEGGGGAAPASQERQQRVQDEIEQRWQQVERTPIREERRVPLSTTQGLDPEELERQLDSYKSGMEELKLQLERVHQQLSVSHREKQCLEEKLRTASEQIRVGYISPLELPMVLEAELEPQMKKQELVSSPAQTLTKKYQETKELLQQQERKKRSMQAQLGLSLSPLSTSEPPIGKIQSSSTPEIAPPEATHTKTLCVVLQDREGTLEELQGLIFSCPLTLKEFVSILDSHSEFDGGSLLCSLEDDALPTSTEMVSSQKLSEGLKYQHDLENESLRRSLAAGAGISEYGAYLAGEDSLPERTQTHKIETLKVPYSSLVEEHSESPEITVRKLSQKVEVLSNENEGLNQRYQELMNQLMEADREIERLKLALFNQQGGQQHLLSEELNQVKAQLAEMQANYVCKELHDKELYIKSEKLQEAQVQLDILTNSLKDTERKLNLKEATLSGLGFQMGKDLKLAEDNSQLHHQLEIYESSIVELKQQLLAAEVSLRAHQAKNEELCLQGLEAESSQKVEIGIYKEMNEKSGKEDKSGIEQLIEEMTVKSKFLSKLMKVLSEADMDDEIEFIELFGGELGSSSGESVDESVKRKIILEAEFWARVIKCINPDNVDELRFAELRSVVDHMLLEKRVLLLAGKVFPQPKLDILQDDSVQNMDTVLEGNVENVKVKISEETSKSEEVFNLFNCLDTETNILIKKELVNTLQGKVCLLNHVTSSLQNPGSGELLALSRRLVDSANQEKQSFAHIHDVAQEAHISYLLSRLDVLQRKAVKEAKLASSTLQHSCQTCAELTRTNEDLRKKLECLQRLEGENLQFVMEIECLDKTIQMQEKELQEVKETYEHETEKLKRNISAMEETSRLRIQENVSEVDLLTTSIESLQKKHEHETEAMEARFTAEIEELKSSQRPLQHRIQELEYQVSLMSEEMKQHECKDQATSLRLKYESDLEKLKATCERGFAAMEESHQKVIEELLRKHQRELENLQEEKERLLAEETAATIAAIEAMKNAHRAELERELEKARKVHCNAENADMEEIRLQHEEELLSFQREIEVLSEQYSQKCLENAHLAQALEAERQALRQCQRENQELNAHNQELNNRLASEITKLRSMTSEDGGNSCALIHGKEVYELEVLLRVKESEVQYLKQEINSLKDELQAAQRDKKYATDKYKDIYTELSIVRAKAERDVSRMHEQLQLAHEALGVHTLEDVEHGCYDIMKSKSNPDILKMAAAAAKRSERTMRSKSLKEGLTAEQRLHLFDNKDTKEF